MMRTLIYAPVIHTSADLGSLAKDATKRGIASIGEEVWEQHTKTVERFWDSIAVYLDSVDVSGMKIYQDGMVADGYVSQKIVEEGIKLGSKNYQLVSNLLKRGATLVKTEDFKLVKEERDRLVALTQLKSRTEKFIAFLKYKLVKARLLNKRDQFIARRIDETLNEKESGIIFIGAYHDIKGKLSKNIQVREVKNIDTVREYQKLLPFFHKHRERFEALSQYLISSVSCPE